MVYRLLRRHQMVAANRTYCSHGNIARKETVLLILQQPVAQKAAALWRAARKSLFYE
ncbi:MAG: hypothetical protein LBK55_05365 [Azoarcus sp.]|jgi:hypothetical protein|nr:hypothetical protein [Azoarcus sp.]